GTKLREPFQPRRALGAGTHRGARLALGVDVSASMAVFLSPAGKQRRYVALHRGQRPHRRNDGQRAGTAVEAHSRRACRRHVPRKHRTLFSGAFVMSDGGGLSMLLLGPAGAGGLYWMLYRYYRNTDKSFDFEHKAKIEAKPAVVEDDKVGEVKGTQK